MNYSSIVTAALGYADREDDETAEMMTVFMSVVESKVNRVLDTRHISYRAVIAMAEEQTYFGLPEGFKKMRDIQLQEAGGALIGTPRYASPEQMNAASISGSTSLLYTIVANQIQIYPAQDTKQIEVVYTKRVQPLTVAAPDNWLSNIAPEVYIYGLVAEISAFVKDPEAIQIWDAKFYTAISTLQHEDDTSRWSGAALQTKTG